ncbi:c-type cytochrome [methane-oxidizing endosymbiont of Gigantopelta aegis]|uniref:c-type cytochrome n=1 Tax=methane-oxidizing endosymbiont of Gigantopelta aegis TaxID=2794938 RepID=UPI0018DCBB65|nr:hypothetical protein [methane-oxidizing endosymbiont of Gigantopelta aegis]
MKRLLIYVVLSVMIKPVMADVDSRLIQMNCQICHSGGTTRLAQFKGLPETERVIVLRDFKTGKRPSLVMGRLLKGLSDREIEQLAKRIDL